MSYVYMPIEALKYVFQETKKDINLNDLKNKKIRFFIDKYPDVSMIKNGFVTINAKIVGSELHNIEIEDIFEKNESEIDINVSDKNSIEMLVGETGTGKTYTAIKSVAGNGPFVIAVPTRQLAYEIFIDYKEVKSIRTGEVTHGNLSDNIVVVYENLNKEIVEQHNSVLIDEAHYLNDYDRGGLLLENVLTAINLNKKVMFMTATDSLSKKLKQKLHVATHQLKPFCKINRKRIMNKNDFLKIAKGQKTLVFCKYTPDWSDKEYYARLFNVNDDNIALLSANTPTSERVKMQYQFKNPKSSLQVVVTTNVLAQGVNFPAKCALIEYNEWDEWEIVQQKIGRVGRPGYDNTDSYYYLQNLPSKTKKADIPKKRKNTAYVYRNIYIGDQNFQEFQIPRIFENSSFEFEDEFEPSDYYKDFKYSKRFLMYLAEINRANDIEKKALEYLLSEENKTMEIVRTLKKPA